MVKIDLPDHEAHNHPMRKKTKGPAGAKPQCPATLDFELVTLALFECHKSAELADTEDVALASARLVPGRFSWKKYPSQINIELIRRALTRAKARDLVSGSQRNGWKLLPKGHRFVADCSRGKAGANIDAPSGPRSLGSTQERIWRQSERKRLLSTRAFQKFAQDSTAVFSRTDLESFFRVDDYVRGKARLEKIALIQMHFGGDKKLGRAVNVLAERLLEIES